MAALNGAGAITGPGNYAFTAASPVPLPRSTAYWVVAEGGGAGLSWRSVNSTSSDIGSAGGWTIADNGEFRTATSTGPFTEFSFGPMYLRVNGVVVNSLARGAPTIVPPNVLRVPATLGVTFAGITDRNGATMIENTALYNWRRFPGSGGVVPDAARIGTGPTYTLTDADAGKRVSVQVWFIDDVGYSEGPQNKTTGGRATAAAHCAAPTLTGGALSLEDPVAVAVGYDSSVSPFAYGYKSGSGVGGISVTPFTTLTGGDHLISSIVTAGNSLIVGLNSALSAIDKRTVALHVCDQAYAFKSGSVSGSTYTFTSPSQDWSGHAERMVYLSQDTAVPTFVEARINGMSLVMTFSEDLGAAASLANSAFTVKNGTGTTQALSGTPSISGRTVTLTLTFNEALRESSVPATSTFTVKATPLGGSEGAVALESSGGVTVSGSTVALKLAVPIAHNDGSVKVSYAKPGTGSVIEDANGNDAAAFADQNVTNSSTIPRVSITAVYPDATPGIAHAEFRVTRSSSGGTALTVNIGITQAAAYLESTTQTITILGGNLSATTTFASKYIGNTNGDLTAAVAEGAGYAPAVAPDNSATVRSYSAGVTPASQSHSQRGRRHCGYGVNLHHRRGCGAAEGRGTHCRGSHASGNRHDQPGLQTYEQKCPCHSGGLEARRRKVVLVHRTPPLNDFR